MTDLHSHVPASGAAPTNVREGSWYILILTVTCPRNSLLKIKKYPFFDKIIPLEFGLYIYKQVYLYTYDRFG